MLTVETWRWSLWALLLAAGTGLAVVAFARRQLDRRPVVVALTALVALDLFVAARGFHPLQPAERVYPAVAELTRLRDEPGPFRVVGAKGALMPNSALVYGVQDVRGYDGLGVAWYADLLDVALAWVQAHQQHELHDADSPILDLLGIRYLMAPPAFAVDAAHWERMADTTAPLHRNRREQPRARLVDGYVVATGNDARRRLRDAAIDLRRDVVLEADPAAGDRPERAGAADAVGTARITGYEHERVEIDTEAPGRRLLVLSDTWFPGWRATVDGAPASIARANVAFRAVTVPAGRHRVVFDVRAGVGPRRRRDLARRAGAHRRLDVRRRASAARQRAPPVSDLLTSRASRRTSAAPAAWRQACGRRSAWRSADTTRSRTGGCVANKRARRGGRSSTRLVRESRRIDDTKASAPPVRRIA